MANLKYYNSGTEEWETLVIGKQGPTGPQGVPGNDGALSPNAVINGGFDIWQRGTSFTNPATAGSYTADRWAAFFQGNGTLTQDTSLVPDNSRFGARITATATSDGNILLQSIETQNAIQFAGKTMTVSGVYAGTVGLNPTVSVTFSTTVDQTLFNITTSIPATSSSIPTSTGSFQQFTAVFSVPSTARTLRIGLNTGAVVNTNFLTFGQIQLEAGSAATPFRRNAPSIQAELAACQRYYWRLSNGGVYRPYGTGVAGNTTSAEIIVNHPTMMRIPPTSIDFSNLLLGDGVVGYAVTSATISNANENKTFIICNVASGLTQFRSYNCLNNGNISVIGHFGLNAEL
jgi:hypothetical protein